MQKRYPILITGFGISLLGSLPPGLMNLAGLTVYHEQGWLAAAQFAGGFVVAEGILVAFVLFVLQRARLQSALLRKLQWSGVILFFVIGLGSLVSLVSSGGQAPVTFTQPALLLGFLISLLNPMHLPYWMGWSLVLQERGWLQASTTHRVGYITGIGLGTIVGFAVFVSAGTQLVDFFDTNRYWLHGSLGIIFLCMSLAQARRLRMLRPAIGKLNKK